MSNSPESAKEARKSLPNTSATFFMFSGGTVMLLGIVGLFLGGDVSAALLILSGAVLCVGSAITEAIHNK